MSATRPERGKPTYDPVTNIYRDRPEPSWCFKLHFVLPAVLGVGTLLVLIAAVAIGRPPDGRAWVAAPCLLVVAGFSWAVISRVEYRIHVDRLEIVPIFAFNAPISRHELKSVGRLRWFTSVWMVGWPRPRLMFFPRRAAVGFTNRLCVRSTTGFYISITPTDPEEFVQRLAHLWSPDVPLKDRRIT